MPKKKYVVKLDDAECQQLEELLRGGQHGARKLTRARILLKASRARTSISHSVSVCRTVQAFLLSRPERFPDTLESERAFLQV